MSRELSLPELVAGRAGSRRYIIVERASIAPQGIKIPCKSMPGERGVGSRF